jgi:D-alanyl-lipoteichoic acid acyltransferase DltB (MBOAT superfamily)
VVFNSLEYLLFFPVVFVAYWQLKRRAQNVLLLIASWFFYALWDPRFLVLMLITTAVDYFVGVYLEDTEDAKKRKRAFSISLILNLSVLGFFKYFNFFVDSGADLLTDVGLSANPPVLEILLPVGISFYTFHGISYTFDVYRKDIRAARDPIDFAVFVAFFPQLVAGPIGRAHIQLPQFEHDRPRLTTDKVIGGLQLILLGLFRKVVIADSLAPFVNDTFAEADSAGWVTLTASAVAFSLQIYGDFAGYSDVARGSSRLLGIELPLNFRQPYLSRNITIFWRTWHISLSNWLRDYLYIPLGGNRGSSAATYRNLMITMVLGGLWHGAAWTFVVWGGLHGLYLCAHRWYPRSSPRTADDAFRVSDVLPTFLTFLFVAFAWIFFRAGTFSEAFDVIGGIFTLRPGPIDGSALALIGGILVLSFGIDLIQRAQSSPSESESSWSEWKHWPAVLQGSVYGLLLLGIVVFSGSPPVEFIYFQF